MILIADGQMLILEKIAIRITAFTEYLGMNQFWNRIIPDSKIHFSLSSPCSQHQPLWMVSSLLLLLFQFRVFLHRVSVAQKFAKNQSRLYLIACLLPDIYLIAPDVSVSKMFLDRSFVGSFSCSQMHFVPITSGWFLGSSICT